MTGWTPGDRRHTPGFIGLGTLQGPRYNVCICPRLHFELQDHAVESYPESPQLLMFLWWWENKLLAHEVPTIQTKVCNLVFLFLSASVPQWKSEQYAATITDKGREWKACADVLHPVCGSCHLDTSSKVSPRTDKTKRGVAFPFSNSPWYQPDYEYAC